jgi:inosose dehydratase
MLKTLAAAAALSAAPMTAISALAADAPATPSGDPWRGLKVGIASYSFRSVSLDACIKGIQRVQLHYVSIKDAHLKMNTSTEERKAVAQKFRDAGITPISCGVIYMKNDEATTRNAFEYARDIGVKTIVGGPDPDALPLCEKLVREFDIKIAIHNHGPTDKHYPKPIDVWNAVKDLDPRIGLCIDVGHTARIGADPVNDIHQFKDRLYDMHFKDVTGLTPKSKEIEVGRGVLDIPGMLRAALEINYQGHVGLEHENDAKDPLPGVAESIGYMKGVMRMLPNSVG